MSHTRPDRPRGLSPWPTLLVLLCGALVLAGCKTLQEMSPATRKAEERSAQLSQLQARNMRFADDYVGRLLESVHGAEIPPADASQRYALSGWLLAQANAAYIDASGANPVTGCLDLVTLATLSRMVVETTAPDRFPNHARQLVQVHRDLEVQAWQLAGEVLTADQQEDLRKFLRAWRARNPETVSAPFVQFQEFLVAPATRPSNQPLMPSSLMGLVGLDPMAGLDPAIRQVEQSRLLAERAVYYAQRVPILFDLQLDRSLNRMASGPESQKLQEQAASLTTSAARFSSAAEALPDTFAKEREALIQQLSDTLSAQQATLMPMLLELRGALEAGHTTATSVDQAVQSIDSLVARFEKKPGEPPGKPFDINEYTQAAAEITRAANQLQVLLGTAATQAPRIDTALDAGLLKGRALVDYFFVRVAWLIALLCAGLLATLLLYRWLAPRVHPE